MILTEIRTEAEYEFLKLWYSCKLMTWNKRSGSIYMVRGEEVLFEQDWENKYLWCNYLKVWCFFESKFRYNDLQIKQMFSGVLEEHLGQVVLTPLIISAAEKIGLEEHLKKGALKPFEWVYSND